MARLHLATLTPSKPELLAAWVPTQVWGPGPDSTIEAVGAFRFDDPEGEVGLETHLVRSAGQLFQVPLTYRNAPLVDSEAALVGTLDHSALGTRWVYDGLRDPCYVRMLAAVALTGHGQSVGMVVLEDRWHVARSPIDLHGGGWSEGGALVDGFDLVADDSAASVLRNDAFELVVHRRPVAGPQPAMGLAATWDGQEERVVLAEVRAL
jgi:Maltokinase N-terminal cap domain